MAMTTAFLVWLQLEILLSCLALTYMKQLNILQCGPGNKNGHSKEQITAWEITDLHFANSLLASSAVYCCGGGAHVLLKLTPFQAFPRDWRRRKNGSGRRRRKRTAATTTTMRTTTKRSMKSPCHMTISENARRTLPHIVGKLLKMSHFGIFHQFLSYLN